MHQQIRDHITKIERLYCELNVPYGVERNVREQADREITVEQAVPSAFSERMLQRLSKLTGELSLNGKKYVCSVSLPDLETDGRRIETKPGRPLCIVPSADNFPCHHAKIQHYPPGNCECVPMPCSCTHCVLAHVKHCAEDYEEAVQRVRLGITKLRAMRRQETGNAPQA